MDVIFKFHKYGFEVCGVVCDGASSNMTMVKELTGSIRKAYGFVYKTEIISIYLCIGLNTSNGKANFEVQRWFQNHYPDRKIHFVICPSHQAHKILYLHSISDFTVVTQYVHYMYIYSSRTLCLLCFNLDQNQ